MEGIDIRWRKSTYSGGNGGECVELADQNGRVLVRDSQNPDGPKLTFSDRNWQRFAEQVKSGALGV